MGLAWDNQGHSQPVAMQRDSSNLRSHEAYMQPYRATPFGHQCVRLSQTQLEYWSMMTLNACYRSKFFLPSCTSTSPESSRSGVLSLLVCLRLQVHLSLCHSCASGNSSHVISASFMRFLIARVRYTQMPCDTKIPTSIAALSYRVRAFSRIRPYESINGVYSYQPIYKTAPRISKVCCATKLNVSGHGPSRAETSQFQPTYRHQ